MEHPVHPRMPRSDVEGCKDPNSKVCVHSNEKWPFYSCLKKQKVPYFMEHPVLQKMPKFNVEDGGDPKSQI